MLQKSSCVIPCDSTGVFLIRVFHVYQHNFANVGSFVKASIRVTQPKNFLKKKRKVKSFILRTKFKFIMPDTSNFVFSENNSIILKKRLKSRGRVVLGPTSYSIKRKKLLKSFIKII